MKKLKSDAIIDKLVVALGPDATLRQQHVYRESLRSLVRLAKAEQMHEIRSTTVRIGANGMARIARKQARELLTAQRLTSAAQRRLEFDPS